MKNNKTLFYIEYIASVTIISVAILISAIVHINTRYKSYDTKELNLAFLESKRIAELYKDCDGDLNKLQTKLEYSSLNEKILVVYYDSNWGIIDINGYVVPKTSVKTNKDNENIEYNNINYDYYITIDANEGSYGAYNKNYKEATITAHSNRSHKEITSLNVATIGIQSEINTIVEPITDETGDNKETLNEQEILNRIIDESLEEIENEKKENNTDVDTDNEDVENEPKLGMINIEDTDDDVQTKVGEGI